MRNFSVDALYVFHEAVPVQASQERFRRASKSGRRTGKGAGGDDGTGDAKSQEKSGGGDGDGDGVGLRRVHRPPVNRLRLDVPELSSELDSRQVRSNAVLRVSMTSETNKKKRKRNEPIFTRGSEVLVFSRESSGLARCQPTIVASRSVHSSTSRNGLPVPVCDAQFFEILDVVKNLLLMPPPLELRSKVEERKRQRRAAGCIDSEKVNVL